MEGDSWYGRRVEDAEGFPVTDIQQIQECHFPDLLKIPSGVFIRYIPVGFFFCLFRSVVYVKSIGKKCSSTQNSPEPTSEL